MGQSAGPQVRTYVGCPLTAAEVVALARTLARLAPCQVGSIRAEASQRVVLLAALPRTDVREADARGSAKTDR